MGEREYILGGNFQMLDALYARLAAAETKAKADRTSINSLKTKLTEVRNERDRLANKQTRHLALIESLCNEFLIFDDAKSEGKYSNPRVPQKLVNEANEALGLPA